MERVAESQYGGVGKPLRGPYGDERSPARMAVGIQPGVILAELIIAQKTRIELTASHAIVEPFFFIFYGSFSAL
jgi:hypothetical protein